MKLEKFLWHRTRVGELCVIRDSGWIVATCWIDDEDLFHIPSKLADREVKNNEWGYLHITNENGTDIKVPCHYIDV